MPKSRTMFFPLSLLLYFSIDLTTDDHDTTTPEINDP